MNDLSDDFDPLVPTAVSPKRRRFRAVPIRVILPNLVTLIALCMGLTAIRFAIEGRYETAVLAIIIAAILDGLDGRIARALQGTSRFGAELDSLADFVDFGVAPALTLYLWSLHEFRSFGWFARWSSRSRLHYALRASTSASTIRIVSPGRMASSPGCRHLLEHALSCYRCISACPNCACRSIIATFSGTSPMC